MQGRLFPRSPEERARAEELGYDVSRILYADDLCAGEQVGARSSAQASRWGPDPLCRRAGGAPTLTLRHPKESGQGIEHAFF